MSNNVSKKGWVKLEYLGKQRGSISFRVGRRRYRAGNNCVHKVIVVHPDDAAALLAKNVFKRYEESEEPEESEESEEKSDA